MFGEIRFYDYRCFTRENPATLPLERGIVSFIGPNNAGKSTLIRSLFELRNAFRTVHDYLDHGDLKRFFQSRFSFGPMVHTTDRTEIIADRNDPNCVIELIVKPEDQTPYTLSKLRLEITADGAHCNPIAFLSNGIDIRATPGIEFGARLSPEAVNLENGRTASVSGMVALLKNILEVHFLGPFRNAINEGGAAHYDLQIGTAFIQQWHNWKTGGVKAQVKAIEQVTDDVRRLIGARNLQINASLEHKTLQTLVNGRPYKLLDLGAGISQLILVLGSAKINQPSFVAIDEPEIHLHPGLQGEFLDCLASYAKHGILFATHSIGLARLNSDRCFSIQKTDRGSLVRQFERTPRYAEFLGSLGIAGLQELGWNRILLVEGPKDVRVFQQLLQRYEKARHTVILPLGGDSLANGKAAEELSEILKFGGEVSAIVDSERSSEADQPIPARVAFADVCKQLGIRCCVTARRAMENYLPQQAITEAFGAAYQALGPYEKREGAGNFWGKSENWRAARFMTKDDIDATDLGQFLRDL